MSDNTLVDSLELSYAVATDRGGELQLIERFNNEEDALALFKRRLTKRPDLTTVLVVIGKAPSQGEG